MTDKEMIINGKKQNCKILFECGSVNDLDSYNMIRKNIEITPENAPVDDYDIRLIANSKSPYGFTSIFKRNKNVDEWEYIGFGHSGACSVVTALLKQLARKTQECEDLISGMDFLQQKLAVKGQEIEELEEAYDTLQNTWIKQSKHLHQYKQTIEKIRNECNEAPMCDTEFSERILTIINEVLKDE